MKQIFFEGISEKLDMGHPEYRMQLTEVADLSVQEGIRLFVELLEDGVAELEVVLFPLLIARPEFFPEIKGSVAVEGRGVHKVEIPFGQFGFRQMVRAFFNYIDGASVRLKAGKAVVLNGMEADIMGDFDVRAGGTLVRAGQGKSFWAGKDLDACVPGALDCAGWEKPYRANGSLGGGARCASGVGSAGEWLEYPVRVFNASEKRRLVNVRACRYGMECLPVDYAPYLMLEAGEEKEFRIRVLVTEDLPAGGVERSNFLFVPDGDGTKARQITLVTAGRRTHPYLVLDGEGWERRRKAILSDAGQYQAFCAEYLQGVAGWEPPAVSGREDFVYPANSQNALFLAAVAWKVTGDADCLRKAMGFLRGLLDGKTGYLATKKSYFEFIEDKKEYVRGDFKVRRAQSAGWVQEAEFFNRVAMSYDLLYEHFTKEEHGQMEACMRNYMEFASWRLTDGDGNNFQIAEAAAGLLCAMALQDYGMVERFLYGYNGVFDLLSAVLLDDGMYFEEASGYVKLAGELFFDIVNAAENFGISVKDVKIPASFDRKILHAPWAMRETWAEDGKPFLGMSFRRFEEFSRATRCLKDYFDCTAKLLTSKGIMFSVNDSNEQDFTRLYQKAYYLYGEESYREIAAQARAAEVLFVREEDGACGKGCVREEKSVLLSGAGFGILREGGCQAVLKFGGHGGYHGHFDRLSLASFFQDGKTFHNNEYAWYGYSSFLFKMWVQTSMAHNMVVVDGRMQKPSPCQCVYYVADGEVEEAKNGRTAQGTEDAKSGGDADLFCAVCAQTTAEWMDPPYGGQTPYPLAFPEEKCKAEGRYILMPETARKQGETGTYSEPVFARRLLVLFHGYCIVWDYLAGQQEHRYDCLYHPMGRFENEGGLVFTKRARFSEDAFGAGQFIRNCHTAQREGPVCLRFHGAPARVNPNDIMDFTPENTVWRAWPCSGAVTIGRYPGREDHFTQEELFATAGFFKEPLKKTVSFTVEGKSAKFVTVLEAGEKQGRIKNVRCENFSTLTVTEENGGMWEICVTGMDDLDAPQNGIKTERHEGKETGKKEKISVKIRKVNLA